MSVERFVIELPQYPVLGDRAAKRIIHDVVIMTAEANPGLKREQLLAIKQEFRIDLVDLEEYIHRVLSVLYHTNLFSYVNRVTDPVSRVDVEISHRSAMVEITWNDRANKDHSRARHHP